MVNRLSASKSVWALGMTLIRDLGSEESLLLTPTLPASFEGSLSWGQMKVFIRPLRLNCPLS